MQAPATHEAPKAPEKPQPIKNMRDLLKVVNPRLPEGMKFTTDVQTELNSGEAITLMAEGFTIAPDGTFEPKFTPAEAYIVAGSLKIEVPDFYIDGWDLADMIHEHERTHGTLRKHALANDTRDVTKDFQIEDIDIQDQYIPADIEAIFAVRLTTEDVGLDGMTYPNEERFLDDFKEAADMYLCDDLFYCSFRDLTVDEVYAE